jgi:hypothetical protein
VTSVLPSVQAGDSAVVDILYLLDRLEEVLASGTRVPFSSRVMLDEQECLDIVDQIRLSLPEEIKVARRVFSERERILAEANEQAEHLIARAEEQVSSRVDDHEIVLAAEQRSQALLERSQQEAQDIRQQADDYASRVLKGLQNRLHQIEAVVEEGLQELRSGQTSDER